MARPAALADRAEYRLAAMAAIGSKKLRTLIWHVWIFLFRLLPRRFKLRGCQAAVLFLGLLFGRVASTIL